jgi:cytochrome c oxidase subunit 2
MSNRNRFFFFSLFIIFVAGTGWNCDPSAFTAEARVPDAGTRQIEIYAQQFAWTIRYAGDDNVLGGSSYKFISEKNPLGLDSADVTGYDDIIVTDTFFLPLYEEADISLHSRDVIHSAYLPHFRAQMNVVPGMTTNLTLKPEKTTKQMRTDQKNPAFDYMLLCNKICGARHYEMKMKVVVGTHEEFQQWLKRHETFIKFHPAPQQPGGIEGDGSEEK